MCPLQLPADVPVDGDGDFWNAPTAGAIDPEAEDHTERPVGADIERPQLDLTGEVAVLYVGVTGTKEHVFRVGVHAGVAK